MHRSFSHSHSAVRGESECEDLANRIERRRAERITITFDVRVALVKKCRQVAVQTNSPSSK